MLTDRGVALDLSRDSPAFVRDQVSQSVWRWRWRRVEERIPALRTGKGGFGAHLQPVFRLLRAKASKQWGPREQGALRSAFANRQWTQCRLYSAGLASSRNCRLCVRFGVCDEGDTDPAHRGTLLHRIWTCPVTEAFRQKMVPTWLYAAAKRAIRSDGTMAPVDLALFTTALVASPAASWEPPPQSETFDGSTSLLMAA